MSNGSLLGGTGSGRRSARLLLLLPLHCRVGIGICERRPSISSIHQQHDEHSHL
jgi:hypothetical protein